MFPILLIRVTKPHRNWDLVWNFVIENILFESHIQSINVSEWRNEDLSFENPITSTIEEEDDSISNVLNTLFYLYFLLSFNNLQGNSNLSMYDIKEKLNFMGILKREVWLGLNGKTTNKRI